MSLFNRLLTSLFLWPFNLLVDSYYPSSQYEAQVSLITGRPRQCCAFLKPLKNEVSYMELPSTICTVLFTKYNQMYPPPHPPVSKQMLGIVIGAGIAIVLIAILIFFVMRRIQLRSKSSRTHLELFSIINLYPSPGFVSLKPFFPLLVPDVCVRICFST